MQALVVVDAQNEFSERGRRPVPNHAAALAAIERRVKEARREGCPIAWVRHHNKPGEDPPGAEAFVPGSWGAELSPGLGPRPGYPEEAEFAKDVFGAFTGTNLGVWLDMVGSDEVLLVGFFAHMCVSTTAREALMGGYGWRSILTLRPATRSATRCWVNSRPTRSAAPHCYTWPTSA